MELSHNGAMRSWISAPCRDYVGRRFADARFATDGTMDCVVSFLRIPISRTLFRMS